MWTFFSVIVICATVIYWSYKYIEPVRKPDKGEQMKDIPDNEQPINFDKVIAEIYDRLEEE